jgi:hypothetical protein
VTPREAIALVGLALAAGAGCAAVTTMETARSLPPGQMQYAIGPEINGGGMRDKRAKVGIPEVAVGARRGVGAGVEVIGKLMVLPLGQALTSIGGELAVKVQLHRGDRLEIAALAGGGYRTISSSGARWEGIYANTPLLFGINVRQRDQIVLGPRVGWQRWYSSGARPVDVPQAGTSIGYAWGVRPSLTVMPEVSWLYSPTGAAGRENGSVLFTAGVGFLFGH